jgi:methyl-accepting chemotaxis protein
MANDNKPRELAEIVENAMREFNEAMHHREQLSVRIGRRTTQIIRFGMFGLSVLGLIMFYLLYILTADFAKITSNMESISGRMTNMNGNFDAVSRDMGRLRQTLVLMNDNITVMPLMNNTIGGIDDNLGALSNDLHAMLEQINHMNGNVAAMTGRMQLLNRQLGDMNLNVGSMSGNMHQMAKPMKMFPFQ